MDVSFNIVAAHCSQQLAKYQQCVFKNQDKDWTAACKNEAKAVTDCADQKVTGLNELKKSCGPQIASFRRCINDHGTESEEVIRVACMNDMQRLWDCTENFNDSMLDTGKPPPSSSNSK